MVEKFQKAPFEEIAAHCGARVSRGCVTLNPHGRSAGERQTVTTRL